MWEFGLREHLWQDLLAACVCTCAFLCWCLCTLREKAEMGSGEVRFMLTSVVLMGSTASDICNLCLIPSLSS